MTITCKIFTQRAPLKPLTLAKQFICSWKNNSHAQVFSGIQPTGLPHLGNYFGAIEQWIKLANERTTTVINSDNSQSLVSLTKPIYAIVDVHSYSSSKTVFGQQLYESILDTLASLMALGLNQNNCTLIRQSDVVEHFYLDCVLDNFVTTNRLTSMTQFKDKTRNEAKKSISSPTPNGLLTYPILQAADILLYRAQLVPVGEDQVQHLELARDIARKFNLKVDCDLFPRPLPLFNLSEHARRVRSLRDPCKKMSKSDVDHKAYVSPLESAELIREKFKKALTDSISAVYYDPQERPAISNLLRIHHLATGLSFDQIRDNYLRLESAQYKLELADIIIERFRDARRLYSELRADKSYLESTFRDGYACVKPMVEETVSKVKYLLGSLR